MEPNRTEAVRLLAQGLKPHEVSDRLDLPEELLTAWNLGDEVAAERARQIDELDKTMMAEANAMFGAAPEETL